MCCRIPRPLSSSASSSFSSSILSLNAPRRSRTRTSTRTRTIEDGFSLVEIMVVIVIIGLLASVVTLNVRSYLNKAKQNTARQEIATIVQALETFYATYSRYPTNEEGLAVLAAPSDKLPEALLKNVPVDAWGHPYQYNCPGTASPYEVICYGADGRDGGTGIDADISSQKLRE